MEKIKMGMVGGGEGAFIGEIHRIAARIDGQIDLVCGAFSRDVERSKRSGHALGIAPERCYRSYQEMFEQELLLDSSDRMDMVSIVTPNSTHFEITLTALEHGFHVLCDKPATMNLDEALELQLKINQSGLLYAIAFTYTGYPLVKEAKHQISSGELGDIRKVIVEYSQGWLGSKESETSKQAQWRLDPKQAGLSCCMGDIGVHAANLAEYMTGLQITDISSFLNTTVEDRVLDDDGTVLLKFNSGAHGVLIASQVCIGDENNLKIRIYGTKASLEWSQLEPNTLWKKFPDQPTQMIRAGVGMLAETTQYHLRTPGGHPEGYLEAFANIYRNFAEAIRLHKHKVNAPNLKGDYPSINEAIRGMAFIEHVVSASESESKWHKFTI